jgi:ABC-type siderophore export system fused ATPase/permease subunit
VSTSSIGVASVLWFLSHSLMIEVVCDVNVVALNTAAAIRRSRALRTMCLARSAETRWASNQSR